MAAAPKPEPGTDVSVQERKPATPEQNALAAINRRLSRGVYLESLAKVLPRGITPDRMVQITLLAVSKNAQLLKCTPESIAEAALDIAKWGLELGRGAYMVPYGEKAQAQVSWQGMVELSMRAGVIAYMTPTLVHANDHFDVRLGTNPGIEHVPAWQQERGEPVGVYAVVTFPNGQRDFELMSKADVEAVRNHYSQAFKRQAGKRGPWESEPLEMWKKTVIRRLQKRLPTPPLLGGVFEYDADEREEAAGEIMAAAQQYRRKHGVSHVRPGDIGYGEDARPTNALRDRQEGQESAEVVDPETGEVMEARPVETTVVDMAAKPPLPKGSSDPGYTDEDLALDQQLAKEQG